MPATWEFALGRKKDKSTMGKRRFEKANHFALSLGFSEE